MHFWIVKWFLEVIVSWSFLAHPVRKALTIINQENQSRTNSEITNSLLNDTEWSLTRLLELSKRVNHILGAKIYLTSKKLIFYFTIPRKRSFFHVYGVDTVSMAILLSPPIGRGVTCKIARRPKENHSRVYSVYASNIYLLRVYSNGTLIVMIYCKGSNVTFLTKGLPSSRSISRYLAGDGRTLDKFKIALKRYQQENKLNFSLNETHGLLQR